ncbi:alpha/beta hydrolase [Sinomicrobium weinanense]|uniref:Alpha/beta fold hydrolase n=1 Tax=Sinomicrobium weinanense TaxID=2842200 RepID=A0A926Q1U4_9FLAO|nr:alpha/beta fold hydrolase [Sinomicrobium weinanense]MBC9796027.1 alpha/beta fold hydrolase [Sinomicrobium weinanense]MBU3123154.1 alpha/beta fold hydrolase [Sinomicrobium weinanense]
MKKQILFIHGGGEGGYKADTKLADSLRKELGDAYEVYNPEIHFNDTLPDFGWLKQIGKEISLTGEKIILAGHSFGASMLLKYLSENRVQKKIDGLFLAAPPYWSGDEDWKQGIKLHKNFADSIPKDIPIFLYHCKDDEEVPFTHLKFYTQNLPQATVRKITGGGHQFNNDLSFMAKDMKSL